MDDDDFMNGSEVPPNLKLPKPHPLFPLPDDAPVEQREIAFVTFQRRVDDVTTYCPEDIPAHEVQSWAQVIEWWGGGAEYKAVAKDADHRVIRYFPAGGQGWLAFDGEPKPFVARAAMRSAAARAKAAVVPPPAPPTPAAPSETDQRWAQLAAVVERLEAKIDARPAAPAAPDNSLLVEMMRQNGEMMVAMVNAAGKRSSGSDTALVPAMLELMQKFIPAPTPHQSVADSIALLKGAREVMAPTEAPAAGSTAGNELKPIVDLVSHMIANDAVKREAPPALPALPAPPPPQPHGEPRYVPGVGLVRVIAQEYPLASGVPAQPAMAAPAVPATAPLPPAVPATAPLPPAVPATAPAPLLPVAAPTVPVTAPAIHAATPAVTGPVTSDPRPAPVAVAQGAPAALEAAPVAMSATSSPHPAPQPRMTEAPRAVEAHTPPTATPTQVSEEPAPILLGPSTLASANAAASEEVLRQLRGLKQMTRAEREVVLRATGRISEQDARDLTAAMDQIPEDALRSFALGLAPEAVALFRAMNGPAGR